MKVRFPLVCLCFCFPPLYVCRCLVAARQVGLPKALAHISTYETYPPSPETALSIRTLDTHNLISTCENAWPYLQIRCQPILQEYVVMQCIAPSHLHCLSPCTICEECLSGIHLLGTHALRPVTCDHARSLLSCHSESLAEREPASPELALS